MLNISLTIDVKYLMIKSPNCSIQPLGDDTDETFFLD